MQSFMERMAYNFFHIIKTKRPCNDPLEFLPTDVVELIFNFLDSASRCRFGAVCRSWRKAYLTRVVLAAPLQEQPPWIVLDLSSYYITNSAYYLLNFSAPHTQHKINQLTYGKKVHIYGSHDTFLAFSSGVQHFLHNPFSGERISLPVSDDDGAYLSHAYDVAMSSNPSGRASFSVQKCLVALQTLGEDAAFIYLCELGIDTHWKQIVSFEDEISCLAFHQEKLYGINKYDDWIFIATKLVDKVEVFFYDLVYPDYTSTLSDINYFKGSDYLVESDEDLLVVKRFDKITQTGFIQCHFKVFKLLTDQLELGLDPEESGLAKVEPVEDLGEKMLFLDGCSISCSSTLYQSQHSSFFKRNCIYFFYQLGKGQYGVKRFDLKDSSTSTVVLPGSGQSFRTHTPPLWITAPPV